MVFAGLIGAILWNLLTWLFGLPSSSSHALFGGLIGAVWVGAGMRGVHFDTVLQKILIPALAHGTNDAQKTMGVITLTLISTGALASGSGPPLWVIAAAGVTIGLGTYLGGWRIIRTMGKGITEIESPQGFAAEASATTVILASSHPPVSGCDNGERCIQAGQEFEAGGVGHVERRGAGEGDRWL